MICIMVYSQEYFTPLFQFWGMTCLRMIIKVTPVAKIIKEVNHAVFNKVEYVASNLVNPWSWGTADNIYLFDLSSGSLGTQAIDFGSTGLGINGNYGSKILGNTNGNYCGDVVLKVSDDGYYMYIYFMFCNGYVGCVQCDCIDM